MEQENRFRERSVNQADERRFYVYKSYNGNCANLQASTTTTYEQGTFVPDAQYEGTYDVVTKDFLRWRGQGMIINNPFLKTKTINIDVPYVQSYGEIYTAPINCSGVIKQRYYGSEVLDNVQSSVSLLTFFGFGYLSLPSLDLDSIRSQASTKAWANADLSKAAILVSMKEARETVKGITDVFVGLIKILREIRSLNLRKLAFRLKPSELADRYMEIRYALRPLVYDAMQAIDAYTAAAIATRQTFRGFAKDDDSAEDVVTKVVGNKTVVAKRTSVITTEARAGVLCRIDDISSLNTWGADALLESVWDCIPLSFVVSWFFNVSDVIRAWTPETGLTPLASWCKLVTTRHQSVECTSSSIAAAGSPVIKLTFNVKGATMSKTSIDVERIPTAERYNLPRFHLNLDTFKLLDLTIIAKKIWQ